MAFVAHDTSSSWDSITVQNEEESTACKPCLSGRLGSTRNSEAERRATTSGSVMARLGVWQRTQHVVEPTAQRVPSADVPALCTHTLSMSSWCPIRPPRHKSVVEHHWSGCERRGVVRAACDAFLREQVVAGACTASQRAAQPVRLAHNRHGIRACLAKCRGHAECVCSELQLRANCVTGVPRFIRASSDWSALLDPPATFILIPR